MYLFYIYLDIYIYVLEYVVFGGVEERDKKDKSGYILATL